MILDPGLQQVAGGGYSDVWGVQVSCVPELSAMATLDTEDMRVLTRSALGPGVGESSSEAEQEARNFSRTSYVIEDPEDDVDDEITAVFNDETEAMTRSDMQEM